MPKLRFRNYICAGMSRKDDDYVAKTSPVYEKLQFSQALNEESETAHEENSCGKQQPKRVLCLPQAPLVPYYEPTVQDGSLLNQNMLDLLDMEVDAAID